jgi:hypothetical protein
MQTPVDPIRSANAGLICDLVGADDEIRTRDHHLGKVRRPIPLTYANARKPALACHSNYSMVRSGSQCYAPSRCLYAACRNGLLKDHSGGLRLLYGPTDLHRGQHHRLGNAAHDIPALDLDATLVRGRHRRADVAIDLLGGALADRQPLRTPEVGLDGEVDIAF